MRIKKEHIEFIKSTAQTLFWDDAKVYLFGSRVDDNKKGGDIDLYIETNVKEKLLQRKLKMMGALHKELGEQKIDIVINNHSTDDKFIYTIARNEGIVL